MSYAKNIHHENLSRQEKIKASSNKNFGLTLGFVFCLLAVLPLLIGKAMPFWLFILGSILLIVALAKPGLLSLPNTLWLRLGLFLNKLVSPLILFILFYFVFLPTGLILKIFSKDILDIKIDKSKKSYWIKSEEMILNMKEQF